MKDYGIKISKPGFDVKTADDKDMVMTSKLQSCNSILTGSFTINLSAYDTVFTYTYTHNLGYRPLVIAYGTLDNANNERIIMPSNTVTGFWEARAYSDRIEFRLLATSGSGTPTGIYHGHFYIFPKEIS